MISSSLAHDIDGALLHPDATDKEGLRVGRIIILLAVIPAGILGIYPLGFATEVSHIVRRG